MNSLGKEPCTYTSDWVGKAISLIETIILSNIQDSGGCSVALTGGQTAAVLYSAWSRSSNFQRLRGVNFYFGDERCVPPSDVKSNYQAVIKNLFWAGIPNDCNVHPINIESTNLESICISYERLLPKIFDLILLTVGDDGHIASLFPGDASILESDKLMISTQRDGESYSRVTITQRVIKNAKKVVVFAPGYVKSEVLKQALENPDDYFLLPARLVLDRLWVLDGG